MKIAVLTDPESASGFRLAGMLVFVAGDPEEAAERLRELVRRDDLGLLAVDQGLVPDPEAVAARELKGREFPVVLPFPSLSFAFGGGDGDTKDYIRRLVKSTIGYEIKL